MNDLSLPFAIDISNTYLLLPSESSSVVSSEPLAFRASVVANDADHFVHVGAHLHAACQAHES